MGGVTLNLRPVTERKIRPTTVQLQPPLHADLHLPNTVLRVPLSVAESLRDALGAVLPERIDPEHDPRTTDADVLRAARSIVQQCGREDVSRMLTQVLIDEGHGPQASHVGLHDSVCPWCEGAGTVPGEPAGLSGTARTYQKCFDCNGTGKRRAQS